MSQTVAEDTRYRPEVVAKLLESHEREAKAAAAREKKRLFTPGRRVAKWFAGVALVTGLSAVGLWSTPRGSAEAAPPPHIEVPEIVVVASAAPPEPQHAPPSEAPATVTAGVLADGRVVLNVATEDELTKLPNVGPARAKAIVALRTKLGKFRQLGELLRVKGIGRKTLAKIAPKAVLDAPAEAR